MTPRRLPLVIGANAIVRMAGGASGVLVGIYVADLAKRGFAIDAMLVGMLGAVSFGAELLGTIPMGVIADAVAPRVLMTGGGLLAAFATLLFGLTRETSLFFVSRTVEGLAAAASVPALLAHVVDATADDRTLRARTMSYFELSLLAGLALGGLLGGHLWRALGPSAFVALACVYLVAAIMLFVGGIGSRSHTARAALAGLARSLREPALLRLAPIWLVKLGAICLLFAKRARLDCRGCSAPPAVLVPRSAEALSEEVTGRSITPAAARVRRLGTQVTAGGAKPLRADSKRRPCRIVQNGSVHVDFSLECWIGICSRARPQWPHSIADTLIQNGGSASRNGAGALGPPVSRHRRFLRLALVAGISVTSLDVVDAHHGRDFLLARTAELPRARQVFVLPRQDVVKNDHAAGIEVEPTLIAGATDWLALEVHSHIEKQPHEAFRYESTAPAIHFGFTSPEHPWAAGASVEYEIGHVADKHDRLEGRFVLSRSTDAMKLALNVFGERDKHSREHAASTDVRWKYGVAVRRRLVEKLDWGAEGQGSLHDSSGHELLFGIYTEPTNRLTVNFGAGTGLGRNGPDFTLRTALVWQLR